jgi:signal transduction histidine kinase
MLELFIYLQKVANKDEIRNLIIITTLIFLIAPTFIVVYIFIYNQRKKRHIEEKELLKSTFQKELLKTQIEVQEQTLNNVSREIHDNITQVLSFVKLNLGMIDEVDASTKSKITESRELVAQTINDLRSLSKSLSFEHIAQIGLVKTLEIEADRLNNSGLINADLLTSGEPYQLGAERELVLFRIFQEALNNTLKHSGAKYLKINLQYSELLFNLTLEDDGIGFSAATAGNDGGSGLKNMQSRAALIGASAVISSSPGKGCLVTVSLNPFEHLYADGAPTDRYS